MMTSWTKKPTSSSKIECLTVSDDDFHVANEDKSTSPDIENDRKRMRIDQ